jgi:hypothetical protein
VSFCKAQQTVVFASEIYYRQNAADYLADKRRYRRACKPPLCPRYKRRVENDISKTRRQGNYQSQTGFFRRHEKALEYVLQYVKRLTRKQNSAVKHAILVSFSLRAQQLGDRRHNKLPRARYDNTDYRRNVNYKRKISVGAFLISLAHGFGNKRASPRAEHKAYRAGYDYQREYKIYSGDRLFPRKIGNEKSVNYAVNADGDHHNNRRKHKYKQFFKCKMFR